MSSFIYGSALYLAVGLAIGIVFAFLRARSWQREIQERDENIESLKSSEKKNEALINNLNTSLEEEKAQLETSAERINNFSNQVKERDSTINQMNTKKLELEETIDRLTTQREDQDRSIQQMKKEIEMHESEIQKLTSQLNSAEEQNAEQESLLLDRANKIETLETRMKAKHDNFTIIAGIGPKVEVILKARKINTFSKLSSLSVENIIEMLEKENPNLIRLVDPTNWPKQAKLAAEDEWEALSALQESLRSRSST
jgi:predicted flap endonuclease-1-like 5' DNA nuclease